MVEKEVIERTLTFLILVFIFAGFVIINTPEFRAGVIYLILTIICFVVYANHDKIGMVVYGIEDIDDSIRAGMIGGFAGIGFYFFNLIIPAFSLAVPFVPYAAIGKWFVIGGLAPIVEEKLFRGVMLGVLEGRGVSFGVVNVIQAIAFAFYHINAYAGEIAASAILSVNGAFVTAIIAGLFFGILIKHLKNPFAPIVAHAFLNGIMLLTLVVAF